MSFDFLLTKFSNLYELAVLGSTSESGAEDYLVNLITRCRKSNVPFVAQVKLNRKFKCEVCGFECGDSIFHFENPAIPNGRNEKHYLWGNPVGIWTQVELKEVHLALAHGIVPSSELLNVVQSVDD